MAGSIPETMKIIQTIAVVAALGLSSGAGFADPEAPATTEAAAEKIAYVADMTGVT
jgi:hypothetical protein